MPLIAKLLITLALGCALGWVLLASSCSLPGIRESNACGHNAYIWLPLALPVGIALSWVLVSWLLRKVGKRPAPSMTVGGDDA